MITQRLPTRNTLHVGGSGRPNPLHPNEQARRLTGRDYLSYSAISTYQKCPLRYYFIYVAGLEPEFKSSSLVFGGAIHKAIEHHFNALFEGSDLPHRNAGVVVADPPRNTAEEPEGPPMAVEKGLGALAGIEAAYCRRWRCTSWPLRPSRVLFTRGTPALSPGRTSSFDSTAI